MSMRRFRLSIPILEKYCGFLMNTFGRKKLLAYWSMNSENRLLVAHTIEKSLRRSLGTVDLM